MNILTAKWPFYVSGPLLALLLAGSLCLFGDPVGLPAAMTAMTEYCDSAVAGQSLRTLFRSADRGGLRRQFQAGILR